MPNRIIKESICTSETIDQMSWFEECFTIGSGRLAMIMAGWMPDPLF